MATITFENICKKSGSNEVLKDLSLVVKKMESAYALAHPAVEKLSYYACLQDLMCQIVVCIFN